MSKERTWRLLRQEPAEAKPEDGIYISIRVKRKGRPRKKPDFEGTFSSVEEAQVATTRFLAKIGMFNTCSEERG